MFDRHSELGIKSSHMTIREKLMNFSFSYIFIITILACVGFLMLYSAGNGSFQPWASRQAIRFLIGFAMMLTVAMIDIRIWIKYAYWLYAISLILLIGVEVMGSIGMGAQRWINLGFFQVQPSELMKITLVLALARYFNGSSLQDIESNTHIIPPLLLTLVPVALILKQPDLGTALMIAMTAGCIFFLVGVQLWKFYTIGAIGLASLPILWHNLHNYQKNRVLTFLDPERDPLGAGYHILQSKITLGSGGIFGKGFMNGSQSHLNFLPEKQTDFIFTMLAEEFGLIGCLTLLFLYFLVIAYGYIFAFKSNNYFGRILALGLTTNFFLYVFINIAMVMGLIPVVGVPLPLISYGGTVLISIMVSFGFILCVLVHQNIQIGRSGTSEDIL